MAKLDKVTFIESLKEMTILEIKELVDAMKEEFGIDPSAVAAAPAAGAGAAAAEDNYFTDFITSEVSSIVFMLIFLAVTAFIVYRGVEKGIEKYNLNRENDQKRFWYDFVQKLRTECINDRFIFQKYTHYDLIVNYKKIFNL